MDLLPESRSLDSILSYRLCGTGSWQGNVIEAAIYIDGAKVLVETFYDNGNPRNTKHYVDNSNSGVWQSYFPDGMSETQQTYQDDALTGPFVEYFRSGNKELAGEIAYIGYRHGKWLRFYECGQLRNETYCDNGRELGPDISFFENGDKQQSCRPNRQRSDGQSQLDDETGRLLQEWSIKDFQRHGDYTEYFTVKNALHKKEHYAADELHGSHEEFDVNSKSLGVSSAYEQGRRHGAWRYFFADGLAKESAHFERGLLEGPYVRQRKEGAWKN